MNEEADYSVIDWDKVTIPMDLAEFKEWFGFALFDERATAAFNGMRAPDAMLDRRRAMREIADEWWREQPINALTELGAMAQASLDATEYVYGLGLVMTNLETRYHAANRLFSRSPMQYLQRLMALGSHGEEGFRRLMRLLIEAAETAIAYRA